jgi:hypothetical protein
MKSVFNFLVEPKNGRTTAAVQIEDKELLLNTELQNHQYTSRLGVVRSTPTAMSTEVQVGDEIIVHHNVFRAFRDIRGKEKNSKSFITEDLFTVSIDQIYAYKRNGEWRAIEGFSFVKPIANNDSFSLEKERPLIGKLKFGGGGIKKGSLIGFTPSSEYEFNIDGERLYRVRNNQITVEYEYQGDEEEYNPSWSQSS